MFNLGVPELVLILVIGLVVFGPKKLPEIGRSVGKGLKEFKKAMNDIKQTIDIESEFKEVAEIKKEVSDIKSGLKEVVMGSDSKPVAQNVSTAAVEEESGTEEESPTLAWVKNSPEWKPDWAADLLEDEGEAAQNTETTAEVEQAPAEQAVVEQSDTVPLVQDKVLSETKEATV